jgi:hypothetical protein
LQELGLTVSSTTVAKYPGRRDGPPSPTWRTFLTNHVSQLASVDFFTVPTATFRVLFVFVVLLHHRRHIVHVNVTAHPTAAWTAQRLREAWPWDTAPRFVIRDRDTIYGSDLRRAAQSMGKPGGRSGSTRRWRSHGPEGHASAMKRRSRCGCTSMIPRVDSNGRMARPPGGRKRRATRRIRC